jgi:spore coat protein CotH
MSRRRAIAFGAGLAASLPSGLTLARQATPDSTTPSISATFLDPSILHDLAASFDQDMYDAMIQAYIDTADKEWLEATVTIDGATYEQAGIRLKGNSSLMGLRGGPGGGPSGNGGNGPGGNDRDTFAGGGNLSADVPERLPWLVRLDKYIDGQNHDGIREFVIRSNNSATALNEAVALDLMAMAGLASQQAAYVRFTVNGSDPALRLAIENPDDAWMLRHFPNGGLLYKAEAGGDYSYRGDDPASYVDVFDLEAGDTGDDQADFTPLFGFLQFINESDDETFATGLAAHLDTEGFATYLAMMDLIANFDDIDGPGNNAYLHVDPDSTMFVVVPWDMNLAFGGAGFMAGGPQFCTTDGEETPASGPAVCTFPQPDEEVPDGGGWLPSLVDLITGTDDGPTVHVADGGRDPAEPNILVERWNEIDAMTSLVSGATGRLRADLFTSGSAGEVLARWTKVLAAEATDMIDASMIESESAPLAEFFTTT